MKPGEFKQHGKFSIEQEGNILIVCVEGPCNNELAENYHKHMAQHIAQLAGQPWASINIFTKEAFFTPDASENLIAGAKRAQEIGFVACAFVIKADEYQNSLKAYWENIYKKAGIDYRFFEHEAEAKLWLTHKLSLN